MTGARHWADFDSWNGSIQELESDVLTDEAFALFRAEPPKHVVGDRGAGAFD